MIATRTGMTEPGRGATAIALASLIALGCGGGQPPRGPDHTPENSPEPQTACQAQRDAAKTAREDLLEQSTDGARTAASAAVLAHAECELEFFRALTVSRSAQNAMLAEIRILRDQYFTTRNLLDEVVAYDVQTINVGGLARMGDLDVAYAQKLTAVPAPTDLQPAQQEAFREELADMGRGFGDQAKLAYASAVDTASGLPEPDDRVREWTKAACVGLARLDPEASRRRAPCSR